MFKKFPSIEQVHTVARQALRFNRTDIKRYVSKVKLHGTNACVRIDFTGNVAAQKRSSDCTPENDNCGFAAFVYANKDYFKATFPVLPQGPTYVWGEWAGEGVQKGDAISQCPKAFHVFMIEFGDGRTIIEDDMGSAFLTSHPQVKWIPVYRYYDFSFFDNASLNRAQEQMESDIEEMSKVDPYVKQVYGVEGPGEGFVFYPIPFDKEMMFKLKTEHHMGNKRVDKKIVSFTPEQVTELEAFVSKYATEPRFNQALTELGISDTFTIKNIGPFLGWVSKDVFKECQAELEVSGLEWKNVASVLTRVSKQWFLRKLV